jgi:hypothetical protein
MFVNSDFTDLLRLFNANSVEYLVIGGYALIQYAEPRYTKDLNLWISTDPKNALAVFQSLKRFGAPLENLTEEDFAEDGFFYQMGAPQCVSISSWESRESNSKRHGKDVRRSGLTICLFCLYRNRI